MIGKEINLGSPKQLQVVLFDELGMPKTKRTKTGYTTDADALPDLFAKTEHPFLQHLLRTATPPGCGHGRGAAQDGRADGRIHTTYNQTIAATGRLSLDRPQPAEHPDPHRGGPPHPRGLRRRRGLRDADDGRLQPDRDADHGAPVRATQALIEAFQSGEDLHTFTASRVFEVRSGRRHAGDALARSRR